MAYQGITWVQLEHETDGAFALRKRESVDALERARVIGVLDAYLLTLPAGWAIELTRWGDDSFEVIVTDADRDNVEPEGRGWSGPTADIARAAAAKAIEAGEV